MLAPPVCMGEELPGHVPLSLHQEVHFLDSPVVGVVQPLGEVLLQVRLEVLVRLPALKEWGGGGLGVTQQVNTRPQKGENNTEKHKR